MNSAWLERDAKAAVDHFGRAGIDTALALRIYSTRLLGREPRLVLHGGGNTSLKTTARDSRRGRGAVRQGLRSRGGIGPPTCRRCGPNRCASARASAVR
jgi:hypothetical protein